MVNQHQMQKTRIAPTTRTRFSKPISSIYTAFSQCLLTLYRLGTVCCQRQVFLLKLPWKREDKRQVKRQFLSPSVNLHTCFQKVWNLVPSAYARKHIIKYNNFVSGLTKDLLDLNLFSHGATSVKNMIFKLGNN